MADGRPVDELPGVTTGDSVGETLSRSTLMRPCRDLQSWSCIGTVLALVACGGSRGGGSPGGTGDGGSAPAVSSVVVSAGGASATLGAADATLQLAASALDAAGSPVANVTFAWSSDDDPVATVDPATGLVTAQRSGIAGIRAMAGTVASPPFPVTVVLPVAHVSVQPPAPVIPTGRSLALGATATDALGGTVPGVSYLWSSADTVHAPVDASGKVQAMLDASGPGALGLGPIAIAAADPVSGKSASAAASVAVYPTWSLATGMAGLTVDVAQGQYVVFANGDASLYHSVVLDTASLSTGLFTGDSAPLQASLAPGSYAFHCGVHPTMHGTLVVH